jgi:alpha-amylase
MTVFREVTSGEAVTGVLTDDHRIAFRRGNKGFFGVNNNPTQPWTLQSFASGLPAGLYCDIISGEPTSSGAGCTGQTLTVDRVGQASVTISPGKTFAVHIGSRANSGGGGGTVSPPASNRSLEETTIYLYKPTKLGQNVFLRGGAKCHDGQNCPVPIRDMVNEVPTNCGTNFKRWTVGNTELTWTGRNDGQSKDAQGTPMYYTTNEPGKPCAECLNQRLGLGDGYWKVTMMMDCSRTNKGWFELKGYMDDWEPNVSQQQVCSGDVSAATPYQSQNHLAKCGHLNVFKWGVGDCRVETSKRC